MDRQKYQSKAKSLLKHPNTYSTIPMDAMSKHMTKLINIFKKIKARNGMDENTYKRMYPIDVNLTDYPKFLKRTLPLDHSLM